MSGYGEGEGSAIGLIHLHITAVLFAYSFVLPIEDGCSMTLEGEGSL